MKGLDAPTIIAIVVAIVVAGALLYFFWTRGANPLGAGVTEAECVTRFLRACGSEAEWNEIVGSSLRAQCYPILKKKIGPEADCISTSGAVRDSDNCVAFCSALEGLQVS